MNLRIFSVLSSFVILAFCFQNCGNFQVDPLRQLNSSSAGPGTSTEEPLTQNIAKLTITTEGGAPITSKDTYVNGHASISPEGTSATNSLEADMRIKGRGNFTWTLDKKPFKIKLNSKSAVMGMPADKDWVLLANHVDKTLIRTSVVYEMSRRLGSIYVPRSQYVDVSLNGQDLGNYTLTEQVKGSSSRVPITEMKKTDVTGDSLTGGYLVELDERMDEVNVWRTSRNVPYALKEPEDATTEQLTYIKDYIQTAETVLYSSQFADPTEGYSKYIDVDSFITLYLIQEITKNKDAANFSSIYLFKERGQKLKMGPPWDFDLAFGNSDVSTINDPTGWHIRTGSPWFRRLFEDPNFEAQVKLKWRSVKAAQLDTLNLYVDRQAYRVGQSQIRNFTIWNIMNIPFFGASVVPGSYEGEVLRLKTWIKQRLEWMDAQFQ